MISEDDISEFGSQAVDPDKLCATNEFHDEWVFLKGDLPFRLRDIKFFKWTVPAMSADGVMLKNGRVVRCGKDGEKLKIINAVQTATYKRDEKHKAAFLRRKDAFLMSVVAPFEG